MEQGRSIRLSQNNFVECGTVQIVLIAESLRSILYFARYCTEMETLWMQQGPRTRSLASCFRRSKKLDFFGSVFKGPRMRSLQKWNFSNGAYRNQRRSRLNIILKGTRKTDPSISILMKEACPARARDNNPECGTVDFRVVVMIHKRYINAYLIESVFKGPHARSLSSCFSSRFQRYPHADQYV